MMPASSVRLCWALLCLASSTDAQQIYNSETGDDVLLLQKSLDVDEDGAGAGNGVSLSSRTSTRNSTQQLQHQHQHQHQHHQQQQQAEKEPAHPQQNHHSWPSLPVAALELLCVALWFLPWSSIFAAFSSRGAQQVDKNESETENLNEDKNENKNMPSQQLSMADGSEPRILHHRVSMVAEKHPERIALIEGSDQENFGQLQSSALCVARHLVEERGVKACSRTAIGVCAEGRSMMHAILGILHTGNPYVPLPSMLPTSQRDAIVEDANITVVLADTTALSPGGAWEGRAEASPAHVLMTSMMSQEGWKFSWTVNESDLAYILFTSGSTGKPKGVMSPHRSHQNRIAWMHQLYPLSEGEVGIQKTALTWIDHVQELFFFPSGGMPLVLAPPESRKDPLALLDLCRQHSVSRLVLVPSLLRAFVDSFGDNFAREVPCLRYFIVSGEPFPTELLRDFLKVAPSGSTVLNLYGSTEDAGDVTWAAYTSNSRLPDGDLVPIGRAIPPHNILLLDPQTLLEVAAGEAGEIFVEGPQVAEGYLNRPEENSARFLELPSLGIKKVFFRTGDFGKLDKDKQIHFLGRNDQQIKVHGQRVETLQVEFALNEALLATGGSVKKRASAVMAVPCNRYVGSYRLLAFIETADCIDESQLRQHMLLRLLPAHIPESCSTLKSLPRLVNGKLDRVALKKLATEACALQSAFVEETDSFGQIRKILAEFIDGRRIVGTMCSFGLFVVVFGHWTDCREKVWSECYDWLEFDLTSSALQIANQVRLVSDDALLIVGVGALHGMGDQSKFQFSAWEPSFVACWLITRWFVKAINDQRDYGLLWFLPMILISRVWVILWHKTITLFGLRDTHAMNALSILVTVALWVFTIDPGSLLYPLTPGSLAEWVDLWIVVPHFGMVSLYLVGFYVVPLVLKHVRAGFHFVLCMSAWVLSIVLMNATYNEMHPHHTTFPPLPYYATHDQDPWHSGWSSPFYFAHWMAARYDGYYCQTPRYCIEQGTRMLCQHVHNPQHVSYDGCMNPAVARLIAVTLSMLHVSLVIAFIVHLPIRVDLTVPGPAMLFIVATHKLNPVDHWRNRGVTIFGVNLFPSLPDVLALANGTPDILRGAYQVFALFTYVIGFMVLVTKGYGLLVGALPRLKRSLKLGL